MKFFVILVMEQGSEPIRMDGKIVDRSFSFYRVPLKNEDKAKNNICPRIQFIVKLLIIFIIYVMCWIM